MNRRAAHHPVSSCRSPHLYAVVVVALNTGMRRGEVFGLGWPRADHDLRHTFAGWLTMRGRPLKEVQELLGHKSIRMTERYSHLAPERLRNAVATLEDFSTTSAHA